MCHTDKLWVRSPGRGYRSPRWDILEDFTTVRPEPPLTYCRSLPHPAALLCPSVPPLEHVTSMDHGKCRVDSGTLGCQSLQQPYTLLRIRVKAVTCPNRAFATGSFQSPGYVLQCSLTVTLPLSFPAHTIPILHLSSSFAPFLLIPHSYSSFKTWLHGLLFLRGSCFPGRVRVLFRLPPYYLCPPLSTPCTDLHHIRPPADVGKGQEN